MNRAIAWFAGNHVAANLLMMLLVVGGLLSIPTIKQELMPELSLDVVTVRVAYPGAAPIEIEEGICIRIEEELQGLQGVKRISSTAAEGACLVSVGLMAGEDVRRRLDEIRSRVDGIDSFPEEAEKPVIVQAEVRFQVLDVAVSGDVDEVTLKRLGQQVRDEIAALPGITDVELVATRPYEVAIEVSEDALLRHDLTFDHVVRAVRRSSLDLPGGSLKTAGGEILIRTKGQAYRGGEFEKLVLLSRPDGSRLRLGDVARVVDGFEETDQLAHFDGQPTTLVEVYRVGHQSALEISTTVREYIEQARGRLPAGVTLTVWQENAKFLRTRLDSLLGNGRDGFALVLLVLALFLRLRLAFWVSLGVPLSFLGTLFVMPSLGLSINLISLMAFIVVLGIVVDDAIVVGENAYTEQSRGAEPLAGAIAGAQGIAMPVVFGVLTTIVAFVPMLFVTGPSGRMVRVIPMIVIACLALLVDRVALRASRPPRSRRLPGDPGQEPRDADLAAFPGRHRFRPAAVDPRGLQARPRDPSRVALSHRRRRPLDLAGRDGGSRRRLAALRLPARGRGRRGSRLSHHAAGNARRGHGRGGGPADARRRGGSARGRCGARIG